MKQPSPERRKARARHNGIKSRYGADAPETLAAREELRALAAEEQITRIVAEAPPLTEAQRARLAVLLLASGTGAVSAG